MSDFHTSALLALPGHDSTQGSPRPILRWLEENARRFAERPAVLGIDRTALSHAGLYRQVAHAATHLHALGLGRGDVVAICLANGPETFAAVLAAAAAAVAFPNPADEPVAFLGDLFARVQAKALIFDAAKPAPFMDLCRGAGLLPLPLRIAAGQPAGVFSFDAPDSAVGIGAEAPRPDDAAVLARTAGTTSRPRIVAWSQASIYRSADTAAGWMGLGEDDRSLCVMPFASLHSLVRSCLPALLRGGSVVCAPGFDKIRIFDWIDAHRPTFMTAVPGILRTMLARREETPRAPVETSLRFFAAGSDRLDSATAQALTAAFGIPVREFYGMNEVAPMLAATEPGRMAQQDGVVGPPLPPWTLEIRDDDGHPLAAGIEGEIAARGGLFNPVLGDRPGRSGRIVDGWYLTGDRGALDGDGRLRVTGRVDERINRGGKKIAPEAVESALALHPAVRQAVVFGVPDPILGERVGAVAVLAPGAESDEKTLRVFLAERLPDYMVPERILVAAEIPTAPSGKVSRRLLAETLATLMVPEPLAAPARLVPGNPTEAVLAGLVAELLGQAGIDLERDFMEMGGDSFLAVSLLVSIEDRFGVLLTPAELLAGGSVAALARLIDERTGAASDAPVLGIRPGTGPALLFTHSPMGYAYYAHAFAKHLGPHIGVYACQWQESEPQSEGSPGETYTMERHAAQYVAALRALHPEGPYCLAGHSFGAHLAYEIAVQLTAGGQQVAFLGLIDDEADLFKRRFAAGPRGPDSARIFHRCRHLLETYAAPVYPGCAELFLAETLLTESLADPLLGWGDLVQGGVVRHVVPGDHVAMMSEDHVARWAGLLEERLLDGWRRAQAPAADTGAMTPVPQHPAWDAAVRARRAGIAGELDREIAEYRSVIAREPAQPYWVYRNLGSALLQRGATEEGLAALRRAIAREAIPVPGYGELAAALRRCARAPEALAVLETAQADLPDLPHAHFALGRLLAEAGALDAAQRHLRRVVGVQPDHANAYFELAKVLGQAGHPGPGIEAIQEALARRPQNPGYRHRLGVLCQAIGDAAAAEAAFRKAIAYDAEFVPAYTGLADLLADGGRLDEAIDIAARAARLRPGQPGLWHRLARLYERTGDATVAQEVRRRARGAAALPG